MHHVISIGIALSLALGTALPVFAQGKNRTSAASYGWQTEIEPAMSEAVKSGKPIFLIFRCEP